MKPYSRYDATVTSGVTYRMLLMLRCRSCLEKPIWLCLVCCGDGGVVSCMSDLSDKIEGGNPIAVKTLYASVCMLTIEGSRKNAETEVVKYV